LHERGGAAMRLGARCSLAVLIAAAPAMAAQAPVPLPERLTALDAKKMEAVRRGDAVAITIESPEKTEVALLGVVRLDVPRAYYLSRVRDSTAVLVTGMQLASGTFGEPATLADVAHLTIDAPDVKELRKCVPLSCALKLPAPLMQTLRAVSASHEGGARVDSSMQQWLVDYVNGYRADSSAEMVVYDDTKGAVSAREAFRALAAEPAPAGIDRQPFALMLAAPRGARPPSVKSKIVWEVDRLPGLKPTLGVNELSVYAPPARTDETLLTVKQLYADHYFEAQVDFITLADGDGPSSAPGMYLVIVRRLKFDDLPSGGLFNIRGRAVRKLRDGLRAALESTKASMEKSYIEGRSAAQ
jgi:hypothetical protein